MSTERSRIRGAVAACAAGILTLLSAALTPGAHADPSQWQSPQSIRDAARARVLEAVGQSRGVSVEAIAVDERLKLPRCAEPLKTLLQSPLRSGQATVAVSCEGSQSWRLFVPVRAIVQRTVVVTRRSVQAGEILGAADVETVTRPSSALPLEYVTDLEQAIGLTVRRTIPTDTVLVPAALVFPQLIERGALVTLISGGGAVLVKSSGVALEPARLKQRVRVRSQSGRIVEGTVEATGEVRVGS